MLTLHPKRSYAHLLPAMCFHLPASAQGIMILQATLLVLALETIMCSSRYVFVEGRRLERSSPCMGKDGSSMHHLYLEQTMIEPSAISMCGETLALILLKDLVGLAGES